MCVGKVLPKNLAVVIRPNLNLRLNLPSTCLPPITYVNFIWHSQLKTTTVNTQPIVITCFLFSLHLLKTIGYQLSPHSFTLLLFKTSLTHVRLPQKRVRMNVNLRSVGSCNLNKKENFIHFCSL